MKTIQETVSFKAKGEEGNYVLPFRIGVTFARLAATSARHGKDAGALWNRSVSALEEVQRLQPNLWQAYALEGSLLEKQGRFKDASDAFRKALSLGGADVSLKQKYIRAKVADVVVSSFGSPLREKSLRGPRTPLREQPTRIRTRRPKSARIRKYYRIGRIRYGA